MKVAYKKDPGKIRENNEDEYLVDEEMGLFVVADGVGGHQAGEVASRLGVETIHRFLKKRVSAGNPDWLEEFIKEAIDQAHQEIWNKALNDPGLKGMGTTIVLGLSQDDKLYVAHVGDSRAYLVSRKEMIPLTKDHSVVAELLKTGKITPKEAKTHHMRHVITQCLGSDRYFGPDINVYSWNQGDVLLLCSDGLTDMVDDKAIKKTVLKKRKNLQDCAEELIKLANKKGGRDNITVVLVVNE